MYKHDCLLNFKHLNLDIVQDFDILISDQRRVPFVDQ